MLTGDMETLGNFFLPFLSVTPFIPLPYLVQLLCLSPIVSSSLWPLTLWSLSLPFFFLIFIFPAPVPFVLIFSLDSGAGWGRLWGGQGCVVVARVRPGCLSCHCAGAP